MLKVDSLFDITNGPAKKDKPKPNQRAPVTESSFHHESWKDMRREVSTWAYIDLNDKRIDLPCSKAWRSNLLAYPALWRLLVSEGHYTKLDLRHVKQDPLENFISQMRTAFGPHDHPTCHQAVNAFKTLLINKHIDFSLKRGSRGKNCHDDGARILTDMQHLLANRKAHASDKEESGAGPSKLRDGLESFPHIVRGLRAP